MITILLSGLKWHAVSPSLYALADYPAAPGEAPQERSGVWLAYNGYAWYLAINGDYDGARPWPSRDCAAAAIAAAFIDHQLQEQGLL